MGCRCDRERLAKRPDAAARHQLQCLVAKALAASRSAKLPKAFWAWDEIVEMNRTGYWPYTPNTNLLYGLAEAMDMILEEGLDNVFARHLRLSAACLEAVRAWGMEIQSVEEAC